MKRPVLASVRARRNRPRVQIIDFQVDQDNSLVSSTDPFELDEDDLQELCFRARPFDVQDDEQFVRPSRLVDDEALRQDLENEQRHERYRIGQPLEARVNTLYKRKADKVKPVDTDQQDGSTPGGLHDWRARAQAKEQAAFDGRPYLFSEWISPRLATFPRGERLTPERMEKLVIGPDLRSLEKEVLLEILYNREGALAWETKEIGRVHPEVAPPQVIRTVPHVPWQAKSFPVPKALEPVVIKLVKDKIYWRLFEIGHGSYRNPFFLVKKKRPGEYRLVIAAQNINRVTIRDANLPPSSDDFAEEFSGMWMTSLLDWLSGYDQIELAKESRDLTGIHTPIGLVRCVTLPQGATNSVAQFVRITNHILREQIPERARPFLDDIAVKGPKTDHGQTEVVPGMRLYVLEHLMNLDQVLLDLKRAGATIAGQKLQLCMNGIEVVGYVCDRDGRHP